jgi:hypothetical protein
MHSDNESMSVRYVIDTSSVMEIPRAYFGELLERAWNIIAALASEGRLGTVVYVFEELERHDSDSAARLTSLKNKILIPDVALFDVVGQVQYQFPKVTRPFNRNNKADTWIIAAAWKFGYTVVCEEGRTGNRPEIRVPFACTELGIPCITLMQLIADES